MGIKKKRVLNLMFQDNYRPMTFEGLQNALNITGDRETRELYTLMEKLEKDGSVFKTLQGRYTPLQGMGLLLGKIQAHFQGYAFLIPEAPGEKDVFIPPDRMGGAMHHDRVIVRILKESKRRRREGEVIRVLSRHNLQVVGTFKGGKAGGVVIPDDRHLPGEIFITRASTLEVREGDKVLVQITRWPGISGNFPQGRIMEVFGASENPGVDITSIQRKYGIPAVFPAKVLKEAKSLEEVQISIASGEKERRDLTGLTMVTIDGEDAKDLDDAVSLEKIAGGGYRLGVHIADVSYYVRAGSALDREASQRATSVYFPDRVIPMLPPQLSNGICSLNPGTLRLSVSVMIDINEEGEWQEYTFSPSFISIDRRMTYDEVNKILHGDEDLRAKYKDFSQTFEEMARLAELLKKRRIKRGALDFNFPEAKIILDEHGKPLEIKVRRDGAAESIIEEFMLLCNEVIALHFQELKVPFIYRVHEQPEGDKLYALKNFLRLQNISKGEMKLSSPQDFQQILETVKGTPAESIVNFVLLRTMPQARYSEKPLGHFGLATGSYTHFTSPIRRYPDLMIHRILHLTLQKKLSAAETRKLSSILPKLVQHCSEKERLALEAERECLELKKVEFMEDRIGEEYDGIISGVTSFGFFVELPNTVEGLIRLASLDDDYYFYDERRYSLVGERTAKKYCLGDPIRIRVERVDKEMRTVYFMPLRKF